MEHTKNLYNLSLNTNLFTLSVTVNKLTGEKRKVFLYVGKKYCIHSLERFRKKKKLRHCIITDLFQTDSGTQFAKVLYLDTGKMGKVNIALLDYPKKP